MSQKERFEKMTERVEKELQYGIRSYLAKRTHNTKKDSKLVKILSIDWQQYAERINERQNLVHVDPMRFEEKLKKTLQYLNNLKN